MSIRLAGAAIFMVAAVYTWFGSGYSAPFGDVLGPSVFTLIVGIPTMLLSASLVAFPSGQTDWPDKSGWLRQGAALAILFGYAATLKGLGFPIATFFLIALLGITLGGKPVKSLILGAVMSLFLWALFDQVLGLPLAFLGAYFGGR
ncbi:tripartite tricarboxylate transporter TctB family protein [Marivita sp. GX14005]|uniref:tripartite tricarboxylate transporter TctB family protein n=1 Tax=Marivita sp. GX14005 TaxID=2942276 RepID=UPI002018FE72|nr:tripartite tricarboxylate transporter TctB family protein [Marivita sp. GX14005]MCL3883271.1 tripartite tricarboxylate transporter TctB family protein [Marivita sp. GX14005]